jgi:Asp-tRNA(Asn)/Glu-tRNA(Gln) amidotransferase A subunit family amidase
MLDRLVSEHGYTLVDIKIPFLPEGQTAHAMTVLTDAATLLPVTKGLTPANRIMLALGTVTPSTDFLLAQKLRHVLMQHLAFLFKLHPGMIIVTPTTACAGWRVGKPVDLKYGVSDGDQTLKTMEYVWMGNFCGLPGISVPAGFVVPEGRKGEGEIAGEEVEGKVPVGLMGMGEWASEEELLWFGADCEEVGQERSSKPPIWVDVIARAKEEMKRTS